VLLGAAPLAAQQVPATLTLDDALAIARERNPLYRSAIARADAAGADVTAGIGAFLPNLQGSMSWNGNSSTRVTGENDYGEPVSLPDPITFRSSSASQSLQSSMTLFNGFQNLNSLRAARAGQLAAEFGVDQQGAGVEAEVRRRFYGALNGDRLIGVEEQLLTVSREQLAATQRLFQVAARTELDVLGAQIQVAQQEQSLARARGEARKRLLELREQIGLDEPTDFRVVGTLPQVFDPTPLDADSLVAVALRTNPRVAQADATANQAAYRATATRGARWPTLSAGASVQRNDSRSSYAALFDVNPQNRGLGFGITVSFPLFTRFQTSQAIAQAAANRTAADEDLRAARLAVERGVRAALIDVETAYRSVQLAQQAVELSRRRLAMAQERYQLGTIDFTQFQQVVTQVSQDERSYLSAELAFATAAVTLEELVGAQVAP
jgi:outer membrane protein